MIYEILEQNYKIRKKRLFRNTAKRTKKDRQTADRQTYKRAIKLEANAGLRY